MYKILLLVLLPIFSIAQTNVQGNITDKKNNPIANVKITIPELNVIVTSNESGLFALIQSDRNLLLILEKDGFQKLEIQQNCALDFTIQLEKTITENSLPL